VSHGHLVDRLERAGYVHRVPDPTDARARLVQMAERGRQVLAVAPYR
jgi:DNA-binding MarR family transcriptional regulator